MAVHLKSARVERWSVAGSFVISRGAKDHVDVVVAEIRQIVARQAVLREKIDAIVADLEGEAQA